MQNSYITVTNKVIILNYCMLKSTLKERLGALSVRVLEDLEPCVVRYCDIEVRWREHQLDILIDLKIEPLVVSCININHKIIINTKPEVEINDKRFENILSGAIGRIHKNIQLQVVNESNGNTKQQRLQFVEGQTVDGWYENLQPGKEFVTKRGAKGKVAMLDYFGLGQSFPLDPLIIVKWLSESEIKDTAFWKEEFTNMTGVSLENFKSSSNTA